MSDPVLLRPGAGEVTDLDLPGGCTSLTITCAEGSAQVMYRFPGEIHQALTLAASLAERVIVAPPGKTSVAITRFDDGISDVSVTFGADADGEAADADA